MQFNLKNALVVNWPIKVTALALATVLWAAVSAEEPTAQLVPVRLHIQPPPNRTLLQEIPSVQALVGGSPRELNKLYAAEPFIVKVIPDTVSGMFFTVTFAPDDVTLGADADVNLQDVVPRRLVVVLDEVAQRTVLVEPRLSVVPDSGFVLMGPIAVRPESVMVVGPQAQVQRIGSVFTMPWERLAVRRSFRETVLIDTTAFGPVRLSPNAVEIEARVERVGVRTLSDLPVVIAGGLWEGEPATVRVILRGPASRLARITPDSLRVTAPAPNLEGDMVPVRVRVPPGVTAAAVPDSVRAERMIL